MSSVALAAGVAFTIALTAAVVTARHFSFLGALLIATGATLAVFASSAVLVRFRQDQSPSSAEEHAAILRILTIVSSLLERYGIEEPEIHPPVKLIETSEASNHTDLDQRVAAARTTSSEFFLSQLVDSSPRLTIILGEAGAGKTSLLLRLTYRMLIDRLENDKEFVPLFFKCYDWSGDYNSFRKWVIATAFKSYNVPLHVTDHWIRSGKLLIALDGLQELSPDCFDAFSDAINSWTRAPEGTRLALSSTMQPGVTELVRLLRVDQLCVIQPIPYSDIRRIIERTLSKLNLHGDVPSSGAMTMWVEELISRDRTLQGPALVGLLAESIGESAQFLDDVERLVDRDDPASVAFLVANSFFTRGDFAAARDAYEAITRLSGSRWHIPAYTLLATCQYLLGEVDRASATMVEAVTLRLRETIRATPDAVPLSGEEIRCLAAVPFDVSFDIAQISSVANLPLSQSRQALQTLRERGLVETVTHDDDKARFRRSVVNTARG